MSFGLTPDKLIIIAVIAVFLIGPDRLPGYAAQLARIVRALRGIADGAKDRMREEMGPEFDEVDWTKLDPRQYDPRRIIRDALLDDTSSSTTPTTTPTSTTTPARVDENPKSDGQATSRYVESAYQKRQRKLGTAAPAPYDGEST